MSNQDLQLDNRTVVITGAASGIGLELVKQANLRQMNIVLSDINFDMLQEVKAQLKLVDSKTLLVKTDVSQEADIANLCELSFKRFGSVELLCNNAGVCLNRLSWEHTAADWEWLIGVNLHSVAHAIRHFVPRMLEQPERSHIVNTASVAGLISTPGMAAYSASKHGVVTLSETLYFELQELQSNLGVSVLCPAWVPTQIHQSQKNRPERFGEHLEPKDELSIEYEKNMAQAVQSGRLTATQIAEEVFKAVVKNQFYIIPHQRINPLIERRMQSILSLNNPEAL